jgi:hypothetical protein
MFQPPTSPSSIFMSSFIINIGIYDGLLTPGLLKSGKWVPSCRKICLFHFKIWRPFHICWYILSLSSSCSFKKERCQSKVMHLIYSEVSKFWTP